MSIRNTTLVAALAVASLLATALPLGSAKAPVTGIVVAESHDNLGSTYTVQPILGSAQPTNQVFAGRGSTFQFFEEKNLLAAYNAATGNHGGYWGCGSGCGQAGILTGGTPSPLANCASPDVTRYAGDVLACSATQASTDMYAGSDAPLSAAQYATAASLSGGSDTNMLTFPIAVGVVGIAYNYPGCTALTLTPAQIAGVTSGAIKHWNQLQTSTDNACINGDTSSITMYVRCDKSGTTFAFTDFLFQSGSGWPTPASSAPLAQPSGVCGQGNPGMAQGVQGHQGSMGYVELDQINALGLQAASVYNKAGVPTAPSVAGAQAAEDARSPTLPKSEQHWSSVSLVWADGVQSYPITTFTYIFSWANPSLLGSYPGTPDQFNALRGFISFVVTSGQSQLPNGLAPLTAAQQANAQRGVSLMHWNAGSTVTFTTGASTANPLSASAATALNGYPALGAIGTATDGGFTPSLTNYGPFAGTLADLAQGHEGQYVSYSGTVVVTGGTFHALTGGNAVGSGIVAPNSGISAGVYNTVYAQIVNGVAVAQAVA